MQLLEYYKDAELSLKSILTSSKTWILHYKPDSALRHGIETPVPTQEILIPSLLQPRNVGVFGFLGHHPHALS
jgi:hypothetical protein